MWQVEAYLGLAEVCTRKSRGFRQSPLEWFWLCVHASSLLGQVGNFFSLSIKFIFLYICYAELHASRGISCNITCI